MSTEFSKLLKTALASCNVGMSEFSDAMGLTNPLANLIANGARRLPKYRINDLIAFFQERGYPTIELLKAWVHEHGNLDLNGLKEKEKHLLLDIAFSHFSSDELDKLTSLVKEFKETKKENPLHDLKEVRAMFLREMRVLRLLSKLKQVDVADAIGVSSIHYSLLERGERKMTPDRLGRLVSLYKDEGHDVTNLYLYGSVAIGKVSLKGMSQEQKRLTTELANTKLTNEQVKQLETFLSELKEESIEH